MAWSVSQEDIVTPAMRAAAAEAKLLSEYSGAIQGFLDAKARERHYDGIQTAITYRDDPNPVFAAEGAALFAWRSAVWTFATAELAKVTSGERSVPPVDAFLGELPTFEWPNI